MGTAALLPLPIPLPAARSGAAGAPLLGALQNAMAEPVNGRIVKSVDEIPAVCLEEDLIAIFRLTSREMRQWRKFPEFIPFPPLPMLDRQIRVSGCVVAVSYTHLRAHETPEHLVCR